jgi:hypothetical protein
MPDWKLDPKIRKDHGCYIKIQDKLESMWKVITSRLDNKYTHPKDALLMCQCVELCCAGEAEVEAKVKVALRHLLNLRKECNNLEPDLPEYITKFYQGASNL